MANRSPIFSAKSHFRQIGFVKGSAAFDLSGIRRCSYDENTGNLTEADSGKVIGHVSLKGIFVGASWIADELFPEPDDGNARAAPANLTAEPNTTSDRQKMDVEKALDTIRLVLGNK